MFCLNKMENHPDTIFQSFLDYSSYNKNCCFSSINSTPLSSLRPDFSKGPTQTPTSDVEIPQQLRGTATIPPQAQLLQMQIICKITRRRGL